MPHCKWCASAADSLCAFDIDGVIRLHLFKLSAVVLRVLYINWLIYFEHKWNFWGMSGVSTVVVFILVVTEFIKVIRITNQRKKMFMLSFCISYLFLYVWTITGSCFFFLSDKKRIEAKERFMVIYVKYLVHMCIVIWEASWGKEDLCLVFISYQNYCYVF